jgi:hypothetical protein
MTLLAMGLTSWLWGQSTLQKHTQNISRRTCARRSWRKCQPIGQLGQRVHVGTHKSLQPFRCSQPRSPNRQFVISNCCMSRVERVLFLMSECKDGFVKCYCLMGNMSGCRFILSDREVPFINQKYTWGLLYLMYGCHNRLWIRPSYQLFSPAASFP